MHNTKLGIWRQKMNHKKNIILAVIFLFPLSISNSLGAYYFYDDFSANNYWTTSRFFYGQEGVVYPMGAITGGEESLFTFNFPGLRIDRRPNDDLDYGENGVWIGRTIRNTNSINITSSPTQPFGFEIIRDQVSLDYAGEFWGGGAGALRDRCTVGIWFYQDDGSIDISAVATRTASEEFKSYPNFIYFYELASYEFSGNTFRDEEYGRIGYYDGNQRNFAPEQMTNLNTGPRGTSVNFINANIAFFRWGPYEDDTESEPSGPPVPGTTAELNNTPVGMKITHNGSKITFYINPNPVEGDGYNETLPNEYFEITSKSVDWNDNIRIMLGHSGRRSDTEIQQVVFHDLLVRSATELSKGSVYPQSMAKSPSAQTVTYVLTNTISPTNAGVNYIVLTKPDVFKWAGPITSSVVVSNHYGNNPTNQGLTTVAFQSGQAWFPAAGEVGVKTNGSQLILLLGSQITNHTATNALEHIWISMDFVVTNDFSTVEFASAIEAIQFDGMTLVQKGKASTCGPQFVIGGTPAQISIAKDPAEGYSSITPNEIIQGADSYSFTYYIQGGGTSIGNEDIEQAGIMIPAVFTIKTNTIDS